MEKPLETVFSTGTQCMAQLSATARATTPSTARLCFATGTTMAMNMPYRATLNALTKEAQLKILELTHGLIATSYDSSMGYRHGPKSFVNDRTLVFVFVSNDPYTRQYDVDILDEIAADGIAQHVVAVQQKADLMFGGESITLGGALLPEAYLALPFVLLAQTVSLNTSIKVGNTPDTPSPTGTVNRVVKGVTIHPFEA